MHGDCHLPHKEKTPSEKNCCSSLCAGVDVLSLSLGLVQWKKSVVCLLCLLLQGAGRKEGTAGRLSQAYPLIQQDILSPVVPLCFLRGWESSPFSAEGGQPSCTHCTHCACTERVSCLAEGGFYTRTRVHYAPAHTHTRAYRSAPLTSLPHRNPIGF